MMLLLRLAHMRQPLHQLLLTLARMRQASLYQLCLSRKHSMIATGDWTENGTQKFEYLKNGLEKWYWELPNTKNN